MLFNCSSVYLVCFNCHHQRSTLSYNTKPWPVNWPQSSTDIILLFALCSGNH